MFFGVGRGFAHLSSLYFYLIRYWVLCSSLMPQIRHAFGPQQISTFTWGTSWHWQGSSKMCQSLRENQENNRSHCAEPLRDSLPAFWTLGPIRERVCYCLPRDFPFIKVVLCRMSRLVNWDTQGHSDWNITHNVHDATLTLCLIWSQISVTVRGRPSA